jgi:hypothetical protein
MQETHRWLSLIGICELLSTNETNIKWLVKHGYLEMMPGNQGKHSARYLDPTPEYARRLRVAETLYGRRQPLPADLDIPSAPVFTIRELAEILGWPIKKARKYVYEKRITAIKGTPGLCLFSARQIRNILWKRTGRKKAYRRAPFLLDDLISYFARYEGEQRQIFPTDEELKADDILVRKWDALARMDPEDRDFAMREFLDKARVAREIVTASREGCRSE